MDKKEAEKPYITVTRIVTILEDKYNPKYGDNRVCECGDVYYRHFDNYDNMEPIGCKYCYCLTFKEEEDVKT